MDPSLALRLPALAWRSAMEAGLACGAFFWGLIAPRPSERADPSEDRGPWRAGQAAPIPIARTKLSVGPANPKSSWTVRSDGSFDPKNGRGGIGAALIDPNGQLVATIAKAVHIGAEVCNGPAVAEYLAATAGLEMALAAGASEVRLQSDNKCLAMFSAGALRAGIRDDLGADALSASKRDMLALFPEFSGLCVEWIDRRKNKLADALSKTGTGKGSASEARDRAWEMFDKGAKLAAAQEAAADKSQAKAAEGRARVQSKVRKAGSGSTEFKSDPSKVLGWKSGSEAPMPEYFGAVVAVEYFDGPKFSAEVAVGGRQSVSGAWTQIAGKAISFKGVEAGTTKAEAVADAAEALAASLAARCLQEPRCVSVALSDLKAFEILAARAERIEAALGEGALVRFCWHPAGAGALGEFYRQAKATAALRRSAEPRSEAPAKEPQAPVRFVVEAAEPELVAEASVEASRPRTVRRGYLRMKVAR